MNPKLQFVVVRFVLSHPEPIEHHIVAGSLDYDSAVETCATRNKDKAPHEQYIVMTRNDYEIAYGKETSE